MSKEEFDAQDSRRQLPELRPGLKFIKVTE